MTKSGVALLLVAASILVAPRAHAGGNDPAAAEALFDEGRSLVKAERFTEACPKFEASQRLDPGVGTLLNLGDCLERVGKTASAWARFREAASMAVVSSQRDREKEARDRALALEPRLLRLAIRPSVEQAGLRIVRDGVVLDRDTWGTAVPVDPGRHAIAASAPGKVGWSQELQIEPAPEGTTRWVDVPKLAADAAPIVSTWGAQRTVSVVTFGAGVAAAAVGAVLALDAKSDYDAARGRCAANGCAEPLRNDAMSAGNQADAATALVIGGSVALVAGVVLFVTAPRGKPRETARARAGGVFGALDLRWAPAFAR